MDRFKVEKLVSQGYKHQVKGDFADQVTDAEAAANGARVYTFDRALHGLSGFAEQ